MTDAVARSANTVNDDVACRQPGDSPYAMLRVLEGPQSGASLTLEAGQTLRIGSSLDNDVVFRGDAIAYVHATITVSCTGADVSATGGEVGLPDGILQPGQSASVAWLASVRMGTTVLQIEAVAAGELPESVASSVSRLLDKTAESEMSQIQNEFNSAADGHRASPQNGQRRLKPYQRRALWLTAIPVFAVLGSLIFGPGAPASVEDKSLARLLSVEPFHTLSIDDSSTPLRVTGFLQTREQGVALRQQLLKSRDAYINRVEIGEQLAERVSDVFRVNGIDATVVAVDADTVNVNTAVRDEKHLDLVTATVKADVPQLTTVMLTNKAPTPDLAPESRADDAGNPGKRVAMIVSESPAYVVTSDRSRYFVGALLPSGHRIAGIEGGRVALEKDGATTFMQF